MADIINLPVPAPESGEERARAEAERQQRLFDWAKAALERLGLTRAVNNANTMLELLAITFDRNSTEVDTEIQNALHPVIGKKERHFVGLNESHLKRLLESRLANLKDERKNKLQGQSGPDWDKEIIKDKAGKIVGNVANLTFILKHAPKWKGVLGFNEFAVQAEIRKHPPWEGSEWRAKPEWTDDHETRTQIWFQRQGVNATERVIGKAVQRAARENKFHPVRSYLRSLVWNGVPTENWLQKYLNVEDIPYTRAIGRRWLISAVARIEQPGCRADHMLVLEGPQGIQKSTALRVLAVNKRWWTGRLSQIGSKDSMMEVAGVWIIEIAELGGITSATPSAMKQFLTNPDDRYRPPFGKHVTREERQCVFAGTVNPPVGGYLRDTTGARRIWPARTDGSKIDVEKLERDRDQLWAEAKALYDAGEQWWLTPEEEKLAAAEQAARYVVDAWDLPIRRWLGNRDNVTVWEVLEGALGLSEAQQTQIATNRVTAILTNMQFDQHRPRTPDGKREYRYFRDPVVAAAAPEAAVAAPEAAVAAAPEQVRSDTQTSPTSPTKRKTTTKRKRKTTATSKRSTKR